ncbi:MAG: O-antigen ligase family protein [Candidatus Promineifilaceae bacterium]
MNKRRLTVLLLLLALISLLTIGALRARQQYLQRGIPQSLPQPTAHSDFRLGLNVYLQQADEQALAQTLDEIAGLGIQVVKQSIYFEEPFDWEASDRLISAVRSHNLELVPLLDGNPGENFAAPTDPAVFAAWAGEFAKRYRDSITYYIIWDEPNITTHWGNQPVNAAEYAALLTPTSDAIRTADSDAVIVAAPLAPTIETGPDNLADPAYLRELYEAGAADSFDIVAAKPYGFDSGPDDRTVNINTLNFSRVILLREVMEAYGDSEKAVWAGNWGWNSLPDDWQGASSIWGETDAQSQANWTIAALTRARQEWPWMGTLFLENWEPDAPSGDPRWGFSIANRETADAIGRFLSAEETAAYPGFYLAQEDALNQQYEGGWRFSPEFGADISESGDRATLTFWGTDVGLRVRRADFRARLYVTVDGTPANALPNDGLGAALVLTSPESTDDFITTVPVAHNLEPGKHTVMLVADRGWDQWALNGYAVLYKPPNMDYILALSGLGVFALLCLGLAIYTGRRADWQPLSGRLRGRFDRFSPRWQAVLTAFIAGLVALTGWLTWGEQAAGIYRRLGDGGQLALTAAAASIFYFAPSFIFYLAALLLLFILIYFRPAWGLTLVAFSAPFYVKPKAMLGYRFSAVEIFLLVTLAAFLLSAVTKIITSHLFYRQSPITNHQLPNYSITQSLRPLDYAVLAFTLVATISLLFTERLDVATNEWRVVMVEPAVFYFLLRFGRLKDNEWATILDAFVLGGLIVALIGLWQVVTGEHLITAEAGLLRLHSIYGSPNNVALYLGRILPFLAAFFLIGQGRRRIAYTLALIPIGLALLLTFSKGALFLGIPTSILVIFVIWQRQNGRRAWPWVVGAGILGVVGLVVAFQIPQLAARLNPSGETGFLRINLWHASLNMFLDHPIFGVGLDNFLYAYRGRYILDAAWREPDLNHPHNILLDLGTRLGLFGIFCGIWLFEAIRRVVWRLPDRVNDKLRPYAVGVIGAFVALFAHGLVDHTFFLIDLAYVFYLLAGTAMWLNTEGTGNS